ncbi:MAG: carboxymuconolactone decarboxylase family protein [Rhodobacteraceae bacterium]|nr:carboxymuconolactone decarboxylase family protein [Paracoccaceae bacterium]
MSTDQAFDAATQTRIDDVRAKRGYLLPHHGLLAMSAPELLAGYDACYSALTLVPRYLSAREREFVWLGVLTVRREFIASQHLTKFLAAGGTLDDVETVTRMAAAAEGAGAFAFLSDHWQHHVPGYDRRASYMEAFERSVNGSNVRPALLHIAACAMHACLERKTELEWHLDACYRHKADENEITEGLTYVMFSGSVPFFIEACGVWQRMIKSGALPAAPAFKAWANLDQSGPG